MSYYPAEDLSILERTEYNGDVYYLIQYKKRGLFINHRHISYHCDWSISKDNIFGSKEDAERVMRMISIHVLSDEDLAFEILKAQV